MEVCSRGVLTKLCSWSFGSINVYKSSGINQQVRSYAARKGTREKARKKKVKVEIQKIGFIAHNLRQNNKLTAATGSKRNKEDMKQKPIDDVWIGDYYAWRIFSFAEALECHRETHHPTIYNQPDAHVNLFIELDMRTAKPTKFVENFRKMVMLPHPFKQDIDRSIIAFCKTPDQKKEAVEAGATIVGGTDVIRDVEKGNIMLPDFDVVVAHPNILADMVSIKGLLKKKFPNPGAGTLGMDIGELVRRFKNGLQYSAVRDENELDYGWIDTPIGQLNMETNQLEENFVYFLNDINTNRPKREGPFITRVASFLKKCFGVGKKSNSVQFPYGCMEAIFCALNRQDNMVFSERILMHSAPSVERLKIDLKPYLEEEEKKDEDDSDDEDEEEQVKVKRV